MSTDVIVALGEMADNADYIAWHIETTGRKVEGAAALRAFAATVRADIKERMAAQVSQ